MLLDFFQHIYCIDKYIKIDTLSIIPENNMCLYCFFQPFVIPITKIEQNIYKWCCLQMLVFTYKKEIMAITEKINKGKEIDSTTNTNNEENSNENSNENVDNISENSENNPVEEQSLNNSEENDNDSEIDPELKIKKEKYKQFEDEFNIFNEFFINQCKEYKKYKEV